MKILHSKLFYRKLKKTYKAPEFNEIDQTLTKDECEHNNCEEYVFSYENFYKMHRLVRENSKMRIEIADL